MINIFDNIVHAGRVVIFDFIVPYIIIRGFIAPWATKFFKDHLMYPTAKWFEKRFLRTERDIAIWLHYRNKALDNGHNHDKWQECNEGKCRDF